MRLKSSQVEQLRSEEAGWVFELIGYGLLFPLFLLHAQIVFNADAIIIFLGDLVDHVR